MPFVLFSFLLLFERKQMLCLGLFLRAASDSAFSFTLLTL